MSAQEQVSHSELGTQGVPDISGAEHYFKRGLETGNKDNRASDNFYLLCHLFKVNNPYAQVRLEAYEKGYLARLMRKGMSMDEAKEEIASLEAQARERVKREFLRV